MNSVYRKLLTVFVSVIVAFSVSVTVFYHITYDHPIIIGESELCEKYRDICIGYGHTLMLNFLGIEAHAQFINIEKKDGQIIIILSSIFPPSRTKVWYSEGDVPYFEMGADSYRD